MSTIAARDRAGPSRSLYQLAGKRCLDLVLATVALLVLLPLLIAITLVVRLSSRGPAIFRQQRVGRGERPFTVLKFRTMHVDIDDNVHRRYVTRLLTEEKPETGGERGLYKLERDPRITKVGAWLRRTSFDELPQLVNVLRGEMSLVGPRPSLAWECELYRQADRRRFDVTPGITGLWQVAGRSRLTMRQALALDVEYTERQSLQLDVAILLRTIPSLFRADAT